MAGFFTFRFMTSVDAAVSMAVCQSAIRSKRGAATEAICLGAAG